MKFSSPSIYYYSKWDGGERTILINNNIKTYQYGLQTSVICLALVLGDMAGDDASPSPSASSSRGDRNRVDFSVSSSSSTSAAATFCAAAAATAAAVDSLSNIIVLRMWLRYGLGYSCEYSHWVCGCRSGAFRNKLNSDGATNGTGWDTGAAVPEDVAGC